MLLFAIFILVYSSSGIIQSYAEQQQDGACSDDVEDDPMLVPMPTPIDPNFKAYARADVSSFYQEPPGSRTEYSPAFKGVAAKFVNISPTRVKLYWENDGGEVIYMDYVGPWKASGVATAVTERFYFASSWDPKNILCRFVVSPETSVYYYDPFTTEEDDEMMKLQPKSRGAYEGRGKEMLSLSTLTAEEKEKYEAHRYNLKFGVEYKKVTGGQEWLSMYPRSAPQHKMWRADYFGQEHYVQTKETHFMKLPPQKELSMLHQLALTRNATEPVVFEDYRSPGMMNMTIKALSCAPRVFEIQNFLSDVEVDHILDMVKAKNLKRSRTSSSSFWSFFNNAIDNTRTSRTAWLARSDSPILDALYRRAADALRIDEAVIRYRPKSYLELGYNEVAKFLEFDPYYPETDKTEKLQIVHYDEGQEYTPHHDFGFHDGIKDKPSRSINICFYLNDVEEGGHTSFPRWRNGETDQALEVIPEKGKAVIFYMINPDGNLDDLTQHAGMPVLKGEKWFANLWISDPHYHYDG